MKSIILADMDGTLTEPREKIMRPMIDAIKAKTKQCDFGIVTGSDLGYVQQQCESLLTFESIDLSKIHLFPCNGTKEYRFVGTRYELQSQVAMINEIGYDKYRSLVSRLLNLQACAAFEYKDLDLTGVFIQYRGSLLNWCPIGRLANSEQRARFVELDRSKHVRIKLKNELEGIIKDQKIPVTIALGGSTSFDIYPHGWDKTFVLRHLDEYDKIYFIGDRCQEGGNDKALYDALSAIPGRAFETDSPEQTIEIIKNISI